MPRISDIAALLEAIAPPALQEDYDNSGLLVGEPATEVTGVLVSLDVTEAVVAEAKAKGCNLIVSHHPLVFRLMKRFTGRDAVERTLMAALRAGIGLYAIHTNLDNVAHGVNAMMADKLGLDDFATLRPSTGTLSKVVTFVPHDHLDAVRDAMFVAGAGNLGDYDECGFVTRARAPSVPNPGPIRMWAASVPERGWRKRGSRWWSNVGTWAAWCPRCSMPIRMTSWPMMSCPWTTLT